MKVVRSIEDAYGHTLREEVCEKASIRQLDSHLCFIDARYELRVKDRPVATMQGGQSYVSTDGHITMWFKGFVTEWEGDDDNNKASFTRETWYVHT